MKPSRKRFLKSGRTPTKCAHLALSACVASMLSACGPGPAPTASAPGSAAAPTNAPAAGTNAATAATGASTNAVASTNAAAGGTNAAPATGATTNVVLAGAPTPAGAPPNVAGAPAPGAPGTPGTPGAPGTPAAGTEKKDDGIQVSFQGANVDMVAQWLAQNTGKTVVKHPRVQCQLTIISSKKVPVREALDLVYRALALEGFNAVETGTSILLLPEGQDVKLSPEVVASSKNAIPEGRQRLIKMFNFNHVRAADLRDKVRAVLSEKATVEVDERANTLMVTDFNENLRLLGDLIKELDITSIGDAVLEIFPLRFADPEDVGNLIGLILNAQSSGSAAVSGRSGGGGGGMPGGGPPGMPGMPGGGGGGGGGSASGGSPQVRLWPDKSANRLIVSTPQARLGEVRKLIEILDAERPQDVTVRVIPLKNVQAVDLVKEVTPMYQKMGNRGAKDSVEVTANERSNSLIVLSSEANYREVVKLVTSLDTDSAQERVMRTFTLKNADAQDVAKQLEQLAAGKDDSSRYPYYFFSYGGESSNKSKKLSVVADRRRNSIVVQAPPSQMDGIVKMVEELDEPVTDDSLAPKMYTLKFISASDVEDVLNELFLKKSQRRSYWDSESDMYTSSTTDRDVGRLYGKVRITSEPYSNTIIVTSNSKENLTVVEEVLNQLDVPSQAGETTLRVSLRFAKASSLANNLNILFAKNGSPFLRQNAPQQQPVPGQPQPQQPSSTPTDANFELGQESKEEGYFPWLGGPPDSTRSSDGRSTTRQVSDLVGRVRVVADHRSNALLVSANVHLLPQILKLVEDMDAPTAQVLIEARIVEVSNDAFDKLGTRWSPDGAKVFTSEDYDGSILGSGTGRYLKGFGGGTAVNSTGNSAGNTSGIGNVGQTLAQLRSGVLDANVNLDVLIQFLKKNTEATVLAEPQINVSDNEMGRLFVGQQVPFISNSQTTDNGGLTQGFQYKSVGIILEVTPHINNSGDVALRIRAESSGIQSGQTLFGGAILDTRNFRTDVTARTGETLVLGGIIQKQVSDTVRKFPVLGDIPGLGWAFKKKDKTVRDVQLMVFLRPKVTRTPEEARALLDGLDTKAPLLKPWKEGIPPGPIEVPKREKKATK